MIAETVRPTDRPAEPIAEHRVAADLLARASDALTAYATYCREVGIVRPAAPLYDLTLLEEVGVVDGIPAPGPKEAMARIIAAGVGASTPDPHAEAEWWADHTRRALRAAGVRITKGECAYCCANIAEDSPGAWFDAMDDGACEDSPTGSHTPDEVDQPHPAHVDCADACGLAVTHDGACLDKPGGRVVCDEDNHEPEDVESLPDCGEDFMAGTICSLPFGHVERDGTAHGTTCRKCGADWYHTGFCDCPPSDDELPAVPKDDDGARVNGFEVVAVRDTGDSMEWTSADLADSWGIYVTYDDAPTMHVEDYESQAAAERIAAALAGKYDGADWRTLPA